MTIDLDCTHFTFVNGTMCKFCGRLQCDLCLNKHKSQHVENEDKELLPEDFK